MLKLIAGVLGVAFSLYLGIIRFKKHKTIDTNAEAEVKEVRKLGMDEGHRVYAIMYQVKTDEPFEICKTPVRRKEKIGKRTTIFFDSNNPKQNYYLKKIGSFDHRLIFPSVILLCSSFLLIYSIVSLF